jgi:PIN domain nuclease of toxin-antitoxin system
MASLKLLLDTHVFLWAIDQPASLSKKAKKALMDEANQLYVSVASIWEIRRKVQAGKLKLPMAPEYLESNLRKLGVKAYLPIELFHIYQTDRLPPIHSDPFDRLLLAQAMVEGMTLVSRDKAISSYGIPVLW